MFHKLFEPLHTTSAVTGKWCVVRACMDMAAQEWLNVGVVFRQSDGSHHVRLINNMDGLRCLYDADTAENLRFLLDQAEHALEIQAPLPDGWNIALGPERFVQGASAQAVLSDLFTRLVPLGKHQLADRADREDHQHATMNVRKTVRQLLASHLQLAKNATPEFWRREPYAVRRDGAEVQMDVQIMATDRGLNLHGAVASAWYKTKYHRHASLSQAVNAVTMAHEAFPSSTNVLYLLQPPPSEATLSPSDHQAIAKDIESSQWLLQQRKATLVLVQSETEMAATILRDLQLLPAVH